MKSFLVGMTGFEPATTRPPDVCATGLRYIPNLKGCKNNGNFLHRKKALLFRGSYFFPIFAQSSKYDRLNQAGQHHFSLLSF